MEQQVVFSLVEQGDVLALRHVCHDSQACLSHPVITGSVTMTVAPEAALSSRRARGMPNKNGPRTTSGRDASSRGGGGRMLRSSIGGEPAAEPAGVVSRRDHGDR
jgi:hypothetical protein